jgi:WD40 repeat protein
MRSLKTSVCPLQAGSQDGRVALFDLSTDTFAPLDTLDASGHDATVHSVAFSTGPGPDRWLAAASGDAVVVYSVSWRLAGGRGAAEAGAQALARLLE